MINPSMPTSSGRQPRINRAGPIAAGAAAAVCCLSLAASAGIKKVTFADQGQLWTDELRARFYDQDQGARMIPLRWLRVLHQPNGTPFLDGALARYGYIPVDQKASELPIGFTTTPSPQGPIVGMTCAACHERQITIADQVLRIDGAPALADFGALIGDLDEAFGRVLASDDAFRAFAGDVLGPDRSQAAVNALRAEADMWWTSFHVLVSRSLPRRPWGPGRLDAIGMIFNRVAGLDIGPPPTTLLPANIARADAPARSPFLWNTPRQDQTQWVGFAQNGNDFLALTRNLAQVYGVFGTFHPMASHSMSSVGGPAGLDRDYLLGNSANFAGLGTLEDSLKRLGPPRWPWALDAVLVQRGAAIFDRTTSKGGCAECHAAREGQARPPALHTLRTVIRNVGTDTRGWRTLLRYVETGSMEGAFVLGAGAPLKHVDLALNVVKTSVLGSIVQMESATQPHVAPSAEMMSQMDGAMKLKVDAGLKPGDVVPNVYAAHVLQGVWAAAPFLHNGSVPTLADLLEPSDRRPKSFAIGSAYDPMSVGLARVQNKAFTLTTTGCEDINSGDSACGHEYGTSLPAEEKRALLEYLKSL